MVKGIKQVLSEENLRRVRAGVATLPENLELVNQQSLIFLVSLLDSYLRELLSELAEIMLRAENGEGRTKSLELIVEDQLSSLRSIVDKTKYLGRRFGVMVEIPENVREVIALRNLLVHNRGIVTQEYATRYPEADQKPGETARVPKEDFLRAAKAVRAVVESVEIRIQSNRDSS